jgi:predicted RNA polymerase sigma factor
VPDTEAEDLLRRLAPQVLGAVVRRYGHFDMAEDATQEALLAAAMRWPDDGIPDNPRGWLVTVASRRLTDMLRGEQARQRREDAVSYLAGGRRPDHGRDRPGVSGAGGDHDPAHQPGQAADQGQRCSVRHATSPGAHRTAPMAEQDRSRWNADYITDGLALLTAALPRGPTGPYPIQAAIAAIHDEAPSAEATDWPQIVALYELLMQTSDSPVVRLNHAVAAAMARGASAGLDLLDKIASDQRIAGDHRLPAVRGHLLEMAGDRVAARDSYQAAARLTTNLPQQRYLHARAARLTQDGS